MQHFPGLRFRAALSISIENFNRQLRKVAKPENMNITEKQTIPIRNLGAISDHLMVYFGGSVKISIRLVKS